MTKISEPARSWTFFLTVFLLLFVLTSGRSSSQVLSRIQDKAAALAPGASDSANDLGEHTSDRKDGPGKALQLPGTVIPAPGHLVKVFVPSTGTVHFATDPPKSVGDRVEQDEVLAVHETHFNYHDYSHLYTERWPLLKEWLEARRRELNSRLAVEEAQHRVNLYRSRADFRTEDSDSEPGHDASILALLLGQLQQARVELAAAEAERKGAEQRLQRHDGQIAKKDLAHLMIRSPISGRIISFDFHQGDLLYEEQQLYTILDLSTVWVKVQVRESDMPLLLEVKSAELRSSAFPTIPFSGKVVRFSPVTGESNRGVEWFLEVANPRQQLLPGMSVTVFLTASEERGEE